MMMMTARSVIDGVCFSCLDQTTYQLYGQTKEYWTHTQHQIARDFIARYEELWRPIIKCSQCDRHVWYTISEDGKWSEESDEGDAEDD